MLHLLLWILIQRAIVLGCRSIFIQYWLVNHFVHLLLFNTLLALWTAVIRIIFLLFLLLILLLGCGIHIRVFDKLDLITIPLVCGASSIAVH